MSRSLEPTDRSSYACSARSPWSWYAPAWAGGCTGCVQTRTERKTLRMCACPLPQLEISGLICLTEGVRVGETRSPGRSGGLACEVRLAKVCGREELLLPRPANGLRGVSRGGVSEEPLDDVWLLLATA